jgi:hypothetical protein
MVTLVHDTPHAVRAQGTDPVVKRPKMHKANPRPEVFPAKRDGSVVEKPSMSLAVVDYALQKDVTLGAKTILVQLACTRQAVQSLGVVCPTQNVRCWKVATRHSTGLERACVLLACLVLTPGVDASHSTGATFPDT